MSYFEHTDDLIKQYFSTLPEAMRLKFETGNQKIIDQFHSNIFLKEGDSIPSFELLNYDSTLKSSSDYLMHSNLLISFYRGEWCPFCNLEIKQYQAYLEDFKAHNVEVVAISPQLPDYQFLFREKHQIDIDVLSDVDNHLAARFGLAYELPHELNKVYKQSLTLDIARYNQKGVYSLPIPATYLINQKGVITYSFIDANYMHRAEIQDVLTAVKDL